MSTLPYFINRQLGKKSTGYSGVNFDHVVSRLVCRTKDLFPVRGEETEVPPFASKFRRDAQNDLLAVCNEDGHILLYDTSRVQTDSLVKTFSAHNNAIFDICWVPDKCQLICGSGDHHATLWDMAHCKRIAVFRKHTASLKSVDVCQAQNFVFSTGSRDGSINVWDVRENAVNHVIKPVITISHAHARKNNMAGCKRRGANRDPVSSVSAVAFQDLNHLASVGVADGAVKIWDLRRTYVTNPKHLPLPRYKMDYADPSTGHGCTSLVFDSRYKTLYACSTSNAILKFDCHSYVKEEVAYVGLMCVTYFIKLDLSSDDQYLLCGSSDEKAYIWKTSKPGFPIVELGAHSAEVTSVCWSPHDFTKLVTCGDDSKVAVWKVASTETTSLGENIHAIAEPYIEGPKNGLRSPDLHLDLNSGTGSNNPNRKSPMEASQTPRKPVMRPITNFFTPITHSAVKAAENPIQEGITVNKIDSTVKTIESSNQNYHSAVKTTGSTIQKDVSVNKSDSAVKTIKGYFQNEIPVNKTDFTVNTEENHIEREIFVNNSDSPSSISKLSNKSPSVEASSHILTLCNHVNKNNSMVHPSPDGNTAEQSTSDDKNSSPEHKTDGVIFPSTSISVQNKENSSTDISPETVPKRTNADHTKRKLASKQSTPVLKRKRTSSSKISKGFTKSDKKKIPGKTIMNYFTVVLSSDD